MDPAGKTFIVTGAARGIGRAIAQRLASGGANLALIDLNAADLDGSLEACRAGGGGARAYAADVAREADVIETVARIATDFGRIDGLVNNAGIVRDGLLVKVRDDGGVDRLPLAQWQAVIDVNLTGTFLCTREVAARMAESRAGGVIVNLSSISRSGNAGQSNYSAAKAGVAAMTVVWAKELGRHGIRVGAVAPGFVRTEMIAAMRPALLEKLEEAVPLRRFARPEEIAEAVAFIVANDYFTGRCLEIDGGLRL
ncbi:MAG: SDR family oxidoreductase [Gammaproteobacteria bacterium]|nr:SDR family oxidoreductase [Gammaproteobacteria bacterium]